jgi:hypothetical protein
MLLAAAIRDLAELMPCERVLSQLRIQHDPALIRGSSIYAAELLLPESMATAGRPHGITS